jgi:hypothetical protein
LEAQRSSGDGDLANVNAFVPESEFKDLAVAGRDMMGLFGRTGRRTASVTL